MTFEPIPRSKDFKPGRTPWREVGLLEVAEVSSGQVDPREEPYRSWPLVAPNHIEQATGRLLPSTSAAEQQAISGKHIFHPGDVLYSKIRPYLRKVALPQFTGLCSADMYPLRSKGLIEPGFLFAILLGEAFTEFATSVSMRTGIPKINREELAQYRFELPSLGEQTKIAAILSSVGDAIEATQAVIDQIHVVKRAMMAELLTRGLPGRHTRFNQTEIGEVPEGWDVVLLDEVAKRGSGHTPSKNHSEYWDGDIKWVSLKDSYQLDRLYISDTEAKITPQGIANSSAIEHPVGTVILSRDAGVGKSAITVDVMAVSQHFMAWVCGARLDNHYLYYWLQLRKPEFERIAIGNTIKTIGLPYFKNLRLALPSLAEQKAVASTLTSADLRVFSEQQQLGALRELKSALMSVLLTGELRVTPDQDPL